MSKFDLGDRVRALKDEHGWYFAGEVGDVRMVDETQNPTLYYIRWLRLNSWVSESDIELASQPTLLPASQQVGTVTLPAGATWSPKSYIVPAPPLTQTQAEALVQQNTSGYWVLSEDGAGPNIRAQRKKDGRCEECGDLLPMSIHGLGECPKHPQPLPPDFKQ